MEEANKEILDNIEQIYKDKEAEINGRIYKITKVNHEKRKKIFAYMMKVQNQISSGDLSFIDSVEFKRVEDIICGLVLFDGFLLSKSQNHWDEYPEDYLKFVTSMLLVFSYPFMRGGTLN